MPYLALIATAVKRKGTLTNRTANTAPESSTDEYRQSDETDSPEETTEKHPEVDGELLEDELPDPSTLNLRCKVSVDSIVPMRKRKGKMRPPLNFLLSLDKLIDWRDMTLEEQRASTTLWIALSKAEKAGIKDAIGTQRRRSAQLASAGQALAPDAETEVAGAAFVSLGSLEADRLAALPQKKSPYVQCRLKVVLTH